MKILAIETSCDETGISIVEGVKTGENSFTFGVLSNVLLSQAVLHAEYGGVYPNLAKREHEKNLPIILKKALAQLKSPASKSGFGAGLPSYSIDAIAVTHGPGLEPALWTGINFAQKLAEEWKLPLIPINHLEGHLLSSLVRDWKIEGVALPVLALLVSGGHTEFVLMPKWFEYEIIGETLDDAVGEAFDKVARMLGLNYPGGPEISRIAEQARQFSKSSGEKSRRGRAVLSSRQNWDKDFSREIFTKFATVTLPRPMLHSGNCNLSFSGLKTAVLYALRDMGGIQNLSEYERANVAREFEDAVADVLVAKMRRAIDETGARTIVLGGGVAANKHLRTTLKVMVTKEYPNIDLRLPSIDITGDNAIMIAEVAIARSLANVQTVPSPESIRAEGSLSISTEK